MSPIEKLKMSWKNRWYGKMCQKIFNEYPYEDMVEILGEMKRDKESKL